MPEEEYFSAEQLRDLLAETGSQLGALNEKVENLIKMHTYGADIADRPDVNTVPKGAEFIIVDDAGEFPAWKSNGTKWVEV